MGSGQFGLDDAAVHLAGAVERQDRHDVDEARMRIGWPLVEAIGLSSSAVIIEPSRTITMAAGAKPFT